MCGEIAHAVQGVAHAQHGDDGTQFTSHGGLTSQELEGALLDLLVELVDAGVAADDALGDGEVGGDEGSGGVLNGSADQTGNGHDQLSRRIEFVTVTVAHGEGPSLRETSILVKRSSSENHFAYCS